jgi:hypothetical protein
MCKNKKIIFLNTSGCYIALKAARVLIFSDCPLKPFAALHFRLNVFFFWPFSFFTISLTTLAACAFQPILRILNFHKKLYCNQKPFIFVSHKKFFNK